MTGLILPKRSRSGIPVSLVQFITSPGTGTDSGHHLPNLLIRGVFRILQRTGMTTAIIHGLVTRFSGVGALVDHHPHAHRVHSGFLPWAWGGNSIPLVPIFLYVAKELGV